MALEVEGLGVNDMGTEDEGEATEGRQRRVQVVGELKSSNGTSPILD